MLNARCQHLQIWTKILHRQLCIIFKQLHIWCICVFSMRINFCQRIVKRSVCQRPLEHNNLQCCVNTYKSYQNVPEKLLQETITIQLFGLDVRVFVMIPWDHSQTSKFLAENIRYIWSILRLQDQLCMFQAGMYNHPHWTLALIHECKCLLCCHISYNWCTANANALFSFVASIFVTLAFKTWHTVYCMRARRTNNLCCLICCFFHVAWVSLEPWW